MYILHLSDLHFGTDENAENWFGQLAADLTKELSCTRLDIVILSGDIGNKSDPSEYATAIQFITDLKNEFGLSREQIVIVPGNHDLNWQLAKKAYRPERREDYEGPISENSIIDKGEYVEVLDHEKYKSRFKHFSNFYQTVTGKPYSLEYDQQGIIYHFPEKNLLILGLNSAWQLDYHYKSRSDINPAAINHALEQIRHNQEYKKCCLKFAVWHHPINSSCNAPITDRDFLERLALADFRIAIHGHIHKSDNSLYKYDQSAGGRKLDIICAGTFGAPVREWNSGHPLQYNLLKLKENKLIVETRCRKALNGAWKPYAEWTQGAGADPLPRYEIILNQEQNEKSSEKKPEQQPEKEQYSVEFVNRLNEINYITNVHCPPYLLISSPMGYGKTMLIQAAKDLLKRQDRLFVHLELSRKKSYSIQEITYLASQYLKEEIGEHLDSITLEKCGEKLAKCIQEVLTKSQQKELIFLIDEAEALNENLAKQFLNKFVPVLMDTLRISDNSIRLRLIFSGRYISKWSQFSSSISLKPLLLASFDFDSVYQTVENYGNIIDSNTTTEYRKEFTSFLMHFTGGHPGCMAKILRNDFGRSIRVIETDEEEYYKAIVKPVIDEIKENIPDGLEEIFETLSVVRRFNHKLIQWLADKGLIKYSTDSFDLEKRLLQAYLVDKKSGFLEDNITRRLLAIRYRITKKNDFIQACEESISAYESMLNDSDFIFPHVIAVELLFQKLQFLYYNDEDNIGKKFFKNLNEILTTLTTVHSKDYVELVVERLKEDWEFRFTMNYLLRFHAVRDIYPFDELMSKIDEFMEVNDV
ncbi:MAG: hypothetical protein GY795_32275 [Desulfobacterales bacterium]|nr:hypothetical protein [Desulfobacterales bacterium]